MSRTGRGAGGGLSFLLGLGVLAFAVAGLRLAQGESRVAADPAGPYATRIGFFDTRAVALAFGHSKLFENELNQARAELAKAAAAGDAEKQQELETMGALWQHRLHQQVFSNAPIDDILQRIEGRLGAIREAAAVDAIVSRVVCAGESVELIDVTRFLVAEFAGEEAVAKILEEMEHAPLVPLEELERDCCDS